MKKIITSFMIVAIMASCLAPSSFAVYEGEHWNVEIVEPRYEAISNISMNFIISDSGRADCRGAVTVLSGYRVELTVELQQKVGNKWNTIHDWEASGRNYISASGPWYVLSGYSYRLKVTATTYDSSGKFIEAPIEYSPIKDY